MKKNNITITHPELLKEWDYEENNKLGIYPEDCTYGSGKKVHWKCTNGHKWQTVVKDRTFGKGCPFCSGRYAIEGENDLQTTNPELAKEWHPTKNKNLKPNMISACSHKKVWWKCNKNHEWAAFIYSRSKGDGCPFCSGQKVWQGFNDLQSLRPDIAKEWHPIKNKSIKPADVTIGSNKKVWWKHEVIKNNQIFLHEWKTEIKRRNRGENCPICSNSQILIGFNDLESQRPDIAKEWNFIRNKNLKPTDVSVGSHKKVWWRCSNNHEWVTTIKNRTFGYGCPICNESKGEKAISEILNKYKIKYTPQYKIKECKHKNSLPFDFGIFDKNYRLILLIEYDGEQHYKSIPHFGGKKSLLHRRQKDKIKTDYCRNNNIQLLRIPYWEFDNINKIVLKKLHKLNLL